MARKNPIASTVKYTIYIIRNGEKTYLDSSLQNTNDKSKAIQMTLAQAITWALKYGSNGIIDL